jgi:hypothetical protein
MQVALYLAAGLTIAVGVAHSWLGERYILIRLFRRPDLPEIFGGTEFTVRTLRFAWHLTSVAWWGFAVILLQLAHGPPTTLVLGATIGGIFLVHAAVALFGSRGRHLAWPVFLAIGLISLYATRTLSAN